jgi:hypothetical protein
MKAFPKIPTLAVYAALLLTPFVARAQTWSTTAKFGSYQLGVYEINNDAWSHQAKTQTLYVDTTSAAAPHFWATTSQSGGGVKTYPHGAINVNQTMLALGSLTGTHNQTQSVSGSGRGTPAYDWAYDIWVPTEVMIWTQWTSNVGPWGTLYQSNVSIGGRTWNVYQPGGPWSFLPTTQYGSGTTDLASILKWLVTGGHLADGMVGSCQYGVEVTAGSGTWTVNSMTIN